MNPLTTWLEELAEALRIEREQGKLGLRESHASSTRGLRPKPAKQTAKPRFRPCKR